jgi:hypothetical protein
MYKQAALIALIVILAVGCQSSPSPLDEAATMVAETVVAAPPTETLQPTFTPLPANTATPKSAATPNNAFTATVEAFQVLSELDVWVGSNSSIPYREGYLAWQQDEPITINMTGPQKDIGALQSIDENLNGANFIFKSDVTWSASGILTCGLVFRAEEDLALGKHYQFYFYRLSGLPAYTIDVYDFGRFKNTISDLKFSEGINSDNGASNEFLIVAKDEQFTIYVNGKRQGQFYDASKQRTDGLFAFLGWQESGKGSCTFEDSWLWILP